MQYNLKITTCVYFYSLDPDVNKKVPPNGGTFKLKIMWLIIVS